MTDDHDTDRQDAALVLMNLSVPSDGQSLRGGGGMESAMGKGVSKAAPRSPMLPSTKLLVSPGRREDGSLPRAKRRRATLV